jgi:hypothetical protein
MGFFFDGHVDGVTTLYFGLKMWEEPGHIKLDMHRRLAWTGGGRRIRLLSIFCLLISPQPYGVGGWLHELHELLN